MNKIAHKYNHDRRPEGQSSQNPEGNDYADTLQRSPLPCRLRGGVAGQWNVDVAE